MPERKRAGLAVLGKNRLGGVVVARHVAKVEVVDADQDVGKTQGDDEGQGGDRQHVRAAARPGDFLDQRKGCWRITRREDVSQAARILSCYAPSLPMPLHAKNVVAVLPAYNAGKKLKATFEDIPQDWVNGLQVRDD